MRRIIRPRQSTLLYGLLLIVILLDDTYARVPFSPCARSAALVRTASLSKAKTNIPSPLSLGLKSALHHQSTATGILVPPVQAFSGGVPLPSPIHHWHHEFFRKVAIRLIPSSRSSSGTEQRRQRDMRSGATATSVATTSSASLEIDIVGSRLIQGIKSALENVGSSSSTAASAAAASLAINPARHLTFWESMACGAVSRSVSQTLTHPANAMKTILQSDGTASIRSLVQRENIRRLTQGAGAQMVLSLPQGAVNFAVLEYTRKLMGDLARRSRLFGDDESAKPNDVVAACLDFVSSAASTAACLVVTGPITVISDNIMSGNYPNLNAAVAGIASRGGVEGFYAGWRPQLAAKIPSYGVTWVFFQRLKALHNNIFQRPLSDMENFIVGSIASGATVSIMMPLDTIKTRLVTQAARRSLATTPYKGITDAAVRIVREEGPGALYRGITPRLASVVPMVAIQFATYEAMKKKCLEYGAEKKY